MSIVRRAAFDIGSGATKLQIADVYITKARTTITKVWYAEEIPVYYGSDWKGSPDGMLSDTIQNQGIEVIKLFLKIAETFDIKLQKDSGTSTSQSRTQVAAIATEVFRKAINGEDYIHRLYDELNLKVIVATQEEEAKVGFMSAASILPPTIDIANVISWDSGGASFQFSALDIDSSSSVTATDTVTTPLPLRTYLGTLGNGVNTHTLISTIQKKVYGSDSTPNPVSKSEVEELSNIIRTTVLPAPDWIIGSNQIYAIGGMSSMFTLGACITGTISSSSSSSATEEEVGNALPNTISFIKNISYMEPVTMFIEKDSLLLGLETCLNKSDDELYTLYCDSITFSDPPKYIIPKLVLLHTLMDILQVSSVQFLPCIGSCM